MLPLAPSALSQKKSTLAEWILCLIHQMLPEVETGGDCGLFRIIQEGINLHRFAETVG